MEYSDTAFAKVGKTSAECNIVYQEVDGRFFIIRKPSSSGAGVAVRVMFGAIGSAIMNSMNDGEELASFTAAGIRQTDLKEKGSWTTFTLYPYSGDGPYEIRIKNKRDLCKILRRELVEKKAAAPAGSYTPTQLPQEFLQETPPAPEPVQPVAPIQPVQPMAPIQPAAPAQPIQPMAPIQPAAPVQPVQPMAPIQPMAPVQQAAPQQYSASPAVNPGYSPYQPVQNPAYQPPAPQPAQTGSIRFHVSSLNAAVSVTLPSFTLGRDSTSDLSLARLPNAKYIARRQATVFRSGGNWYIRDENSTNGTFLNNRQIPGGQPQQLSQGDFLSFAGKETLIVLELK